MSRRPPPEAATATPNARETDPDRDGAGTPPAGDTGAALAQEMHVEARAQEKKDLRRRMRALRLVADQKQGPDAARGLVRSFMPCREQLGAVAGRVVAGYWPIITEIDIRPLMAKLDALGMVCALPVVVAPLQPLCFRRWRLEEDLEPGAHETMHPPASAEVLIPDLVLVPLLAFDDAGRRLGQGGGHYDRTLAALRAAGPVTAVGVGYAAQRIERVPRAEADQDLDWILTEAGCAPVRR
jgi:5-formyltetrahydrofolate cyclo-ligase